MYVCMHVCGEGMCFLQAPGGFPPAFSTPQGRHSMVVYSKDPSHHWCDSGWSSNLATPPPRRPPANNPSTNLRDRLA